MGIKPTSPDTRFWLDQYDVSGFLNTGGQSWDNEIIESGNFATTAKTETVSGKYTEKATETILFDVAAGAASIDTILHGFAVGGDVAHYRGRSWGAHSEGYPVYETIEVMASKPLTAAEGQILLMNGAWSQAGPTSRGLILRNATVTGTGNGTGRNQGITPAASTYQVVFRVLGGTFTSITMQVQQSSDNGVGDAYSLITGLTATRTTPGVVRVTFTGATEAWKRVAVTAFSGSNAIIVVTGGRVKGT